MVGTVAVTPAVQAALRTLDGESLKLGHEAHLRDNRGSDIEKAFSHEVVRRRVLYELAFITWLGGDPDGESSEGAADQEDG